MMMQNLLGWSLLLGMLEDAGRAPMTERLLWATLVLCTGILAFVWSQRHRAAHDALKSQLRHHLDALAKAEKTTEHLRKGAAAAQTARHAAEVSEAQHRRRAFEAKNKIVLLETDITQERDHSRRLEDEAQRLRVFVAEKRDATFAKQPRASFARASKIEAAPTILEAVVPPSPEAAPPEPAPPSREDVLGEELRAYKLASVSQAAEEKERLRRALIELRGAKKRVEDLRRIDLMSRNKVSLLEDRLARLGREHYEAISALCAARGETPEAHPRSRPEEPSSLQH